MFLLLFQMKKKTNLHFYRNLAHILAPTKIIPFGQLISNIYYTRTLDTKHIHFMCIKKNLLLLKTHIKHWELNTRSMLPLLLRAIQILCVLYNNWQPTINNNHNSNISLSTQKNVESNKISQFEFLCFWIWDSWKWNWESWPGRVLSESWSSTLHQILFLYVWHKCFVVILAYFWLHQRNQSEVQ